MADDEKKKAPASAKKKAPERQYSAPEWAQRAGLPSHDRVRLCLFVVPGWRNPNYTGPGLGEITKTWKQWESSWKDCLEGKNQ